MKQNLLVILPELWLVFSAFGLLFLGLFSKKEASSLVLRLAFWATLVSFGLLFVVPTLSQEPIYGQSAFYGMVQISLLGQFLKGLILLGAGAVLLLSQGQLKRYGINRFEYPVLLLLATVGLCLMIAAGNYLSLYMAIELQSLAFYVVAALRRESLKATEAGLKYFLLGALSSGLLLYGISLIYGVTGTTSYAGVEAVLNVESNLMLVAGLVFLIAGLAFKVSAVPFHMWTPDVYEGAPTPVTAFFAGAPKIAGLGTLMIVLLSSFGDTPKLWGQVLVVLSFASIFLGAIAGLVQENIKRLLAYSSIGHVGFVLLGFAAEAYLPESLKGQGVSSALTYMVIYLLTTVGAFGVLLALSKATEKKEGLETFEDFRGLSKKVPGLAFVFALFLFSMAGIPPLVGFVAKLKVFSVAIEANLLFLAIAGILASVVSAYYYLKVIKMMYFEEAEDVKSVVVTASLGAKLFIYSAAIIALIGWLAGGPLFSFINKAVQLFF